LHNASRCVENPLRGFQREGFFAGLSSVDENPFGLFIAMETFAGLKSFGFRSAR
jgi:hypothetical protein